MKKLLSLCILIISILFTTQSCTNAQQKNQDSAQFMEENISFAAEQYGLMLNKVEDSASIVNPKSFIEGKMKYIRPQEWTSGFFPGNLWYIYELTGDEKWKTMATKYTEALDTIQYYTGNHDVGFMIYCSYGNGLRLAGTEAYKEVIVNAAKSLSTRYIPEAGIIQSWNANKSKDWECPVIIDNMMNLELLFEATKLSGDSSFYHIAVTHADNTIRNHYRPDYSTWHVIDYSKSDGSVRHRNTHQGYSDDSAWARGQSWGIYGFILCYRETKDQKYLDQAEKALNFIASHPNYPEDGVPYWDFDAPDIPNTYRDASAGAILASALYELSTYSDKMDYKAWADTIVASLASPVYRAPLGENGNFLLMHSVGSLPHNSEVDVPLNYADYYFLEALKRKRDLE
ncbi:MAG: glucuronyl hydrolase [Bacteroidetes bacterium GWD2_45_23]|nr:MAG: glucuronyl hydrolase [Bacteroidetes bacterium GWC2_46_850]OFX78269.1 MAG: glucuronyl hydrolase [Bacteroidetes bacterium GWC1_47_7]OFX87581.1 MAG: glucuronyl hydrolase [Bacteroidetes bacterium GWD2_45_23]HBB01466.1 glucuronyl hydrolase [Porphyromonadaceae bacterium]HCC19085.1 glucuronyl hydrolase [Porphyromonadaceae bacterium]